MNVNFHPSVFETQQAHTPEDKRSLLSVQKQRDQRLMNSNIDMLESHGSFKLTTNDDIVAESNTKHLFKNLYGETLLTSLFFSRENIENIQNLIRFVVHRETQYTIDRQSYNELLVIMRSIFLEYSAHPRLIDDTLSIEQKNALLAKYKAEVARLNEIVINTVIPKIVSQLEQYLTYLRDASQAPYQMDTPQSDSISGQRQYRSVTQVLMGGGL